MIGLLCLTRGCQELGSGGRSGGNDAEVPLAGVQESGIEAI